MGKEVTSFIATHKIYDLATTMIQLYESKDETFFQLGEDKITFDDIHKMLDEGDNDSLRLTCNENTFKNFVSIFENYIKDVLEYLYSTYPQHIFCKKEKLDMSKLNEFNTLEELKDRIIKEKVIALSYDNLSKMVKDMGVEFNIKFDLSEEENNKLVEITNVRNIMVHNRGIVNEKFLNNVKNSEQSFELEQWIIIGTEDISGFYNFYIDIVNKLHGKIMDKYGKNSD